MLVGIFHAKNFFTVLWKIMLLDMPLKFISEFDKNTLINLKNITKNIIFHKNKNFREKFFCAKIFFIIFEIIKSLLRAKCCQDVV